MDDKQIVDLFFERNENAISETEKKYSRYVNYIASNILPLKEDCEECASDVYLRLWSSIPPAKPDRPKRTKAAITDRMYGINLFKAFPKALGFLFFLSFCFLSFIAYPFI